MSVTGRDGFSLVEVVVWAAVLLVVCLATTSAESVVRRSSYSGAQLVRARSEVNTTIERLRGLPFWDSASARDADGGSSSVLAEVFPHACPERNTDNAWYAETSTQGCPPGSFTTIVRVSHGVLKVSARFVVCAVDGYRAVETEAVDGYALEGGLTVPSDAIAVDVDFLPSEGAPSLLGVHTVIRACETDASCGPKCASGPIGEDQ
jgi:hypothetical protein